MKKAIIKSIRLILCLAELMVLVPISILLLASIDLLFGNEDEGHPEV